MFDYTTIDRVCQVLQDATERKRMVKTSNQELQLYFEKTKQIAKAGRVRECANIMTWKRWQDPEQTVKLNSLNLCRERLCANCATALGRKKFAELLNAFSGVKNVYFGTVTVDNVSGNALRITTQKMLTAFKAMVRKLKIKDYFRSIEVTHNKEENTYHPHIHFVYTETDASQHKRVKATWIECIHSAGIRTKYAWVACKVLPIKEEKQYFELCKYVTKPNGINQTTIPVLDKAMKGIQLKRGSKSVTDKSIAYRKASKAEQAETEKRLSEYEWDLFQYIWNGENYIPH